MSNVALTEAFDDTKRKAFFAGFRKGLFHFLAGMVNNRPSTDLVTSLIDGRDGIYQSFFALGDIEREFFSGVKEMYSFLEEVSTHDVDEVATKLSVDWTRLFRGVQKGYGPPPPFESLYSDKGQTGVEVLRKVARRYREAGLEMGNILPNRLDYLGVELEFLAILAEQEETAWEKGDRATAQTKLNTTNYFIEEHLELWAKRYCELAQNHAKTLFYHGLLMMIRASLERDDLESIVGYLITQSK